MAQPRDYTRQYNFNDFQTTNPSDPLPGNQVDGELDAVKLTLDDLNANIGKIQRDDGKLKNAAVHKDAFSQDALALVNSDFTPRGDWATATSYAVNDAVDFNGATYVATVAHTSSAAFSTDDAADRWILIANAAISGTGSAVDKFEGDGNTTSFTLTYTYASETAVQVFVNGELLNPVDDYTISGNTLTLYTAPGLPTVAGNENVIVWGASVVAQAAAQDASGHESNASGYADESEAWASQTSGIVESTDYSSKAYAIGGTGVDTIAGSAKDWATKTSGTVGNTGEYSAKYWATQADVGTVASLSTEISNLAAIQSQLLIVNGIWPDVVTVAGISANTTTVAGISTDVTTVAGNNANITTLAGLNTEIAALGPISSDITTVSGISANTTTVAGISADVSVAAGISANITTVSGISSDVTTVATANANVTAIATDLTGTNTIGTTAGAIANVNIVANAITNVNSAAQNIADINTVAGQINNNNLQTIANDIQAVITTANDLNEATSEIDTVANSIANVDLVGGSISNVNTVATNLTSVNAFFDTYFVSATVPTSPTTGDLWFDTSTSSMKVYTGNSFVNAGSAVNGTADRYTYTATANQTTFSGADDNNNTLAYDAGFIDVYMNGVKLMPGDITATNGTSIVLTGGGAAANDTIEIVAYGTFELANININSMTDVSTTGVENGSLLVYNDANSQFETSGEYKVVYDSTTHTATNLAFYTTNGSNIAEVALTRAGHGLSIGDYVRIDSSSVTTWLAQWNLFDLTSIAQIVRVVDVYNDSFFVNITCNSVQTSSSSLSQGGTYYYDTGVARISAPEIEFTASNVSASGDVTAAKYNNNEALPTVRPSLLLDFANSKTLDPRITFTRGSTATYWDGKTTTKAEENLFAYSQTHNNAYWDYSRMSPTGSQTAPDGTSTAWKWTQYSTDTTAGYFGHLSWGYTSGTYTFSGYFKAGSDGGHVLLDERSGSGQKRTFFNLNTGSVGTTDASHTAQITHVGNGWYRCSITFTVPASMNTQLLFYFGSADGQATSTIAQNGEAGYSWGLQYEQRSSATAYTPTTSAPITKYQPTLQTAASGEARFDHDPVTGESKGLLIEESRTNLHLTSESATNHIGLLAMDVISNDAIAPDGTKTADFVYPTTGTQRHEIQPRWSATSGVTYAFSAYIKAVGTITEVSLSHTGGSQVTALFDLENGTATNRGSQSGSHAKIEDAGNGWYRCILVGDATSSNSNYSMYISPGDGGQTLGSGATVFDSLAANGANGILLWGVQVETGDFATSYIPTSGSTVTRALDRCTFLDLSKIDYNQGNGTTLLVEGQARNKGLRGLLNFSSSNEVNFYGICETIGSVDGRLRASSSYEVIGNTVTGLQAGEYFTTAMSIDFNNVSARSATNGILSTEDTSFSQTVPNQINRLAIGTISSSNYALNGCIKKAAIYPKAFNAATITAMTEE